MSAQDPFYCDAAIQERVWSLVPKGDPNDCWIWPRARSRGYGSYTHQARPRPHRWVVRLAVHRLVYAMFNGPIGSGLVVRHLCHNPPCCNPAHLAIGTHADNARDREEAGRGLIGARNHSTKLTEAQVIEIRRLRADGLKLREIAERFNVTLENVHYICTRQTWGHI